MCAYSSDCLAASIHVHSFPGGVLCACQGLWQSVFWRSHVFRTSIVIPDASTVVTGWEMGHYTGSLQAGSRLMCRSSTYPNVVEPQVPGETPVNCGVIPAGLAPAPILAGEDSHPGRGIFLTSWPRLRRISRPSEGPEKVETLSDQFPARLGFWRVVRARCATSPLLQLQINKSLSALGDVIEALTKAASVTSHFSRLTQLRYEIRGFALLRVSLRETKPIPSKSWSSPFYSGHPKGPFEAFQAPAGPRKEWTRIWDGLAFILISLIDSLYTCAAPSAF